MRAEVLVEPAWGVGQLQHPVGVVNDGFDVLAGSSSTRLVFGQPIDIGRAHGRDSVDVEPAKASLMPSHFALTTFQLMPAVKMAKLIASR